MKKVILALALVAMMTGMVHAAAHSDPLVYCFDFNDLRKGDKDSTISQYMSDIYGSEVITNRACVGQGLGFGLDPYLTSKLLSNSFEILFTEEPIIAAKFKGHIFTPLLGPEFHFRAYYQDVLVYGFDHKVPPQTFQTPWIYFPGPVDKLYFSNSGILDVAIDDLCVKIPAPGAMLLGMIGLGVIGRIKRRMA